MFKQKGNCGMKIYQFYILKTLICMTGFLIGALALGSDSLLLFWVAIMSLVASLIFYFAGE
jgi:hypothetical protein